MNTYAYTRFELLRTFRSKRFFVMSLGFPLVIYLLIALPNRGVSDFAGTGISAPLYYMVGLAAFGAMAAILSSGTRIAGERAVGWNRQLRITPLTTRAYLRTKVLTGYLMALLTVGLLYLAGSALGVRLPAADWLHMTLLMIVALIPLAALGILLGHLLTVDSMGPALGGTTSLFAILGGAWGPLASGGFLGAAVKWVPSYWLVKAGQTVVGGGAWPAQAWIVIGLWTAVSIRLAVRVYGRDTQRV